MVLLKDVLLAVALTYASSVFCLLADKMHRVGLKAHYTVVSQRWRLLTRLWRATDLLSAKAQLYCWRWRWLTRHCSACGNRQNVQAITPFRLNSTLYSHIAAVALANVVVVWLCLWLKYRQKVVICTSTYSRIARGGVSSRDWSDALSVHRQDVQANSLQIK